MSGWQNFDFITVLLFIIFLVLVVAVISLFVLHAEKIWNLSPMMLIGLGIALFGFLIIFVGLFKAIWSGA